MSEGGGPLLSVSLVASVNAADVAFLIVLSVLIVGLMYGQNMFEPGYTFKRHLIKVAVITAAGLAVALIRLIF
jgi:hypothetical protein